MRPPSLQLQYSPALGSSAVSHSNLVFTDGWGYTISVEGYSQSQEPGFQPSSILSPFGNLLIQNLAGNPHNMGWGNTLTSAVDPGLCNQIGDIATFVFLAIKSNRLARKLFELAVAVGTIIADRPPHRSVRARLRIRLPPRMAGVKALHRIRM